MFKYLSVLCFILICSLGNLSSCSDDTFDDGLPHSDVDSDSDNDSDSDTDYDNSWQCLICG